MNEIIKQHDAIITEVFESQQDFNAHEIECAKYKPVFDDLLEKLRMRVKHADSVRGKFGSFCPYLQYIRIDFVSPKDWANNISDNSNFIDFEFNLKDKSFEIIRYGHIWMTDHDMKKTFCAMWSMKDVHKAIGKKWMRKSKYSDNDKVVKKISTFIDDMFDTLNRTTTGYPYHQMAINIAD